MTNEPSSTPSAEPPAEPSPAPAASDTQVFAAELLGTAVLVIIGPGSAIIAADVIGAFGVAFAFGLALLAMAYTIGHVSGCHINPAVTLGALLTRAITPIQAGYYWAAQFAGAAIGGLVVYVITDAGDLDQTGVFAANGWGHDIGSRFGLGPAILVELVFTALLVFVVLSTTTVGYPAGFGGLAVGLTLAMIHLATIPVDNTSVNPARSFGAALYSGSDALTQLWVFIVFPLIGAALGVLAWMVVHGRSLDDTLVSTWSTSTSSARRTRR